MIEHKFERWIPETMQMSYINLIIFLGTFIPYIGKYGIFLFENFKNVIFLKNFGLELFFDSIFLVSVPWKIQNYTRNLFSHNMSE